MQFWGHGNLTIGGDENIVRAGSAQKKSIEVSACGFAIFVG